jgi:hypothetical protein
MKKGNSDGSAPANGRTEIRPQPTWVSYPVLRKWERSLHTCAHDVQIISIVTI